MSERRLVSHHLDGFLFHQMLCYSAIGMGNENYSTEGLPVDDSLDVE